MSNAPFFGIQIGIVDEFSKNFDKFSQRLRNLTRSVDRFSAKTKRIGRAMSVGVSAPLAVGATLALRTAAEFEKLRTSLITVTGGTKTAAAAFDMLTKFAAETPFQLQEVVGGFIKLKARGIDPTKETLTAFGNTASAMGKSLDQMIEAAADAAMGEFERLKEFGVKAKSQGDRVKFIFDGTSKVVKKTSEDITRYLKWLGQKRFAGGIERQAATIGGSFSNLRDAVDFSLATIGDDIAKAMDLNQIVRNIAAGINRLTESFSGLPGPVKEVVGWMTVVGIVLGPMIYAAGQFIFILAVMLPHLAALKALLLAIKFGLLAAFGVLAKLKVVFVAIKGVVVLFAGALAGASALVIGVVAAIVAAVSALIVWFVYAYKQAGSVGGAFRLMGSQIVAAFMFVAGSIKRLANAVMEPWAALGSFIFNALAPAFARALAVADSFVQAAGAKIKALADFIKTAFVQVGGAILAALVEPLDIVITTGKGLFDQFTAKLPSWLQGTPATAEASGHPETSSSFGDLSAAYGPAALPAAAPATKAMAGLSGTVGGGVIPGAAPDIGGQGNALVEVVFKNQPPGMRADITQTDGVDVSIEQGVSMVAVY